VLVTVVLAVLAVVTAVSWAAGAPDPTRLGLAGAHGGVYGTLQAAGLLFFAFAGYARIATMGEEVRDPARTIPRAIVIALAVTVVVYAVVAVTLLAVLGAGRVAASAAPLADLAAAAHWGPAAVLVAVGGAAAALGALLALIAGIGRTTLAMAREGDLPHRLAAVHPTYRVPHHADIAIGAVVTLLVLTVDLRGAIGFSSFGVLLYSSSRTSPRSPSPPTCDGSRGPCRSSARQAAWCWSPPCPGRQSSRASRSSSRASPTGPSAPEQPDRPDTVDRGRPQPRRRRDRRRGVTRTGELDDRMHQRHQPRDHQHHTTQYPATRSATARRAGTR
jgi:hypothetical protein